MIPGEKTLRERLHLTPDVAKRLRRILDGREDPRTVEACDRWVRRCHSMPSRDEQVMEAANALMECAGVEAIYNRDSVCSVAAIFANTGESYAETLMLVYGRHSWEPDRFRVSSWGDFVERQEKRGRKFL